MEICQGVPVNSFEEAALRLKQQLRVKTDKEAAEVLGLSAVAWVGRKNRGNFPETELYALAAKRPELGLDVEYVLTGGRLAPRERDHLASARALTLQAPMEEAERQRLLALLDAGFVEQAATNAARQPDYRRLIETLNACSDESLRLVLQVAEKFRASDAAISRAAQGSADGDRQGHGA